MGKYVWLFPLLFIFHDMEEIIGFGIFLKKNKRMLDRKYPFVSRTYEPFSTEGIAFGVFEQFAVCLLFCILALLTDSRYVWLIWLGGLIAYTLHLLIHMVQAAVIRTYIPALATSILCLPVSLWCIVRSIETLCASVGEIIVFGVIGTVIVAVNLKFAQSLIRRFTRWMEGNMGKE